MSENDKQLQVAEGLNLRSIIVEKKTDDVEHKFNSKLNKLKKQYLLMVASIDSEKEELQEKFIENCSEKNFSLESLIYIKDEMDLLDRKKKIANEIYCQLVGEE
jgi:hypothetical protein